MDTQEATRMSLRDILHVIFKRKIQILLFFIATVFTVAVGTFIVKPTYEATSQILVKIGRENLYMPVVPTGGNQNPVIHVNREEQINSEIEILKGRSLAQKVVEALGPRIIYEDLGDGERGILKGFFSRAEARESLPKKAVLRLQKGITVEGVKKANVIEVRFKHTDPQIAATVVNKLVSLYLDHHLQVHKEPRSYKFFQDQSDVLEKKLQQAEEKLMAFKKRHDINALDEERSLLLREKADLRAELNQTLSQVAETENRIQQLRHQIAVTPRTIPQGSEINTNPFLINTLQARLVELELEEKKLLIKYTEQNRLVLNVRDEIRMVRAKLADQEKKRYGKSLSGLNTTYQRLQEDLFRSEADLKALMAKKETQNSQLGEYRERLEKLNRIEVDLKKLQQEVDVDRQNYKLYLTKFEESRMSDAMDTEKMANVSLIEAARPPLKPVSPKKKLNLALALFLGAFGALGLAFFMEYLDDSLERPDDVESTLNVPVLASIPELKQ